MRYKGSIKFYAEDFYSILEKQKYKCPLTGRDLQPNNSEVELIFPCKVEGRAELSNHYIIDRNISPIARYLSESQIIELAIEIVKHRGAEFGYTLKQVKKK